MASRTPGFGGRTQSPRQPPGPGHLKKPLNGKERQSAKAGPQATSLQKTSSGSGAAGTTAASPQLQSSGADLVDEKSIRFAKQQPKYQKFLDEAHQRDLKRKQLDTRNKMWQEQSDKAKARLQAIEEERRKVLQLVETMDAARTTYNANNGVEISLEMDKATEAKWTAYFNLETDELEV